MASMRGIAMNSERGLASADFFRTSRWNFLSDPSLSPGAGLKQVRKKALNAVSILRPLENPNEWSAALVGQIGEYVPVAAEKARHAGAGRHPRLLCIAWIKRFCDADKKVVDAGLRPLLSGILKLSKEHGRQSLENRPKSCRQTTI